MRVLVNNFIRLEFEGLFGGNVVDCLGFELYVEGKRELWRVCE